MTGQEKAKMIVIITLSTMFYIDRGNICTDVVFNILVSRDELTKQYYNHFIISDISVF